MPRRVFAAGIAITKKPQIRCNAAFESVGRDVFAVCKNFIAARREIFVYFPLLDKHI